MEREFSGLSRRRAREKNYVEAPDEERARAPRLLYCNHPPRKGEGEREREERGISRISRCRELQIHYERAGESFIEFWSRVAVLE